MVLEFSECIFVQVADIQSYKQICYSMLDMLKQVVQPGPILKSYISPYMQFGQTQLMKQRKATYAVFTFQTLTDVAAMHLNTVYDSTHVH